MINITKKSKDVIRKEIASHPIFKNKNYKIYLRQTEEENSKMLLDCYNLIIYTIIRIEGTEDENKKQALAEIRALTKFKFDIYKIKMLLSNSQINFDKGRYRLMLLQEIRKDNEKVDDIINLLTDLQPFGIPLDKYEDEKDLYADVEGDDDAASPI
jgi:hypothetical protein